MSETRIVLLLILIVTAGTSRAQQLFNYTQYMHNLTPINPAYSLLDKAGSVNAIARKQWVGVNGAPSTFMFNGSLPIEPAGAAAGFIVLHDEFAVEHLTEINAYFAKSIQLNVNQYLAVALNGGIRNYIANYSSLDATDPQFRNDVRETKPNIGFSILYYSLNYYLGLSVPELTTRTLGTASTTDNNYFKSHYNVSGAYLFGDASEDLRLKPAVLATYTNGRPVIANLSMTMYIKNTVGIGTNYSTTKELAGILYVTTDIFKLGYSYQFGTVSNNQAQGFHNNTHEITLTYRFGKNINDRGLL